MSLRTYILCIWFLVSGLAASAQQSLRDQVAPLINKAHIAEAEKKVDAALAKDSNNVEALILKANIILNKYSYTMPDIALAGNPDESIYSSNMGYIQENTLIPPVDIADQVSHLLLRALKLSPDREDIYYGLCYVYSISRQTNKLKDFLPLVVKHIKLDAQSPYTLAQYAQNLMDRDRVEEGLQVYEKIAELFPDDGSIRSDVAGQYFMHGYPDKGREYIQKALSAKKIDPMSYGNAFFIYGVLKEYDNALSAIKKQSELNGNKNYLFYQGLLDLNAGKDWRSDIQTYLKSKPGDTASLHVAKLMLSDTFKNLPLAYSRIVASSINDAYKIPLHKYFYAQLKDFNSGFNYAEALTYNQRYPDAISAFNHIDTASASRDDLEKLHFFKGWALYKAHARELAINCWHPLLYSNNFYYQSAAAYFTGKYYLDQGNNEQGVLYMMMVSDRASESKYAAFCAGIVQGKF